jgi:subtilisin-like proprotein convertase family protein
VKNPTSRLSLVLASALAWALTTGVARAEWNSTPIAVPLQNANAPNQPGSPYPSRIDVHAPGGPTHYGSKVVILHGVTHPCPEDLAILLVHGTEKYLLMSNAGGCHPLKGTDMAFYAIPAPLPDEDPETTPYGFSFPVGASNYGPQPVFPAPAPPGPYISSVPYDSATLEGAWDLYVMDTRAGNRGVIAGGWSIDYRQEFGGPSETVPAIIPDFGPAATYPITFDFSGAAADTRVRSVRLYLWLDHSYADDVRIVLQSPTGTSVVVMSNAGGNSPFVGTQELEFSDTAASYIPDEGPIAAGSIVSYKPGSEYGGATPSLPGPAPPAPYATAFSAFTNELARGVWKLWVYDHLAVFGGQVVNASLVVNPDRGTPGVSIDLPTTTGLTTTSTQPFVNLVAFVGNIDRPISAIWKNLTLDGSIWTDGSLSILPVGGAGSYVLANVPVQKGFNRLFVRVYANSGSSRSAFIDVNVNEFTYSLPEGSTGAFWDEDVTLGNPADVTAPVRLDFLQEGAPPVSHADAVAANAPLQVRVNGLVPAGAVSTIVHSMDAVPLAVERTMSWDGTGYGGHGGTAIQPDTQWLFAEGSQGYFDTFLLLANDKDADANVTVRFLLEGGGNVDKPVTVQAHKRVTIYAADVPQLINNNFGMQVTSDIPITAERSMYFPHGQGRVFEGGHEAAGVNDVSKRWFLAEGATGPFFECFILLSNPLTRDAHATLTYLLPSGETIPQNVTVPALGRFTVNVETVDQRLRNADVSTIVTSDVGIIVERSMYWPDISLGWKEAHNSPGVVDPALRWGVSDIRVGGTRAYETFILLANPNAAPAEVQVRLLKQGAAPIVQSYTLPPTSRTNIRPVDLGATAGTYSAEVQVLNFQGIVVEKAMYWNSGDDVWAAGTGVVATPLPPR